MSVNIAKLVGEAVEYRLSCASNTLKGKVLKIDPDRHLGRGWVVMEQEPTQYAPRHFLLSVDAIAWIRADPDFISS